MMTLAVYFRSSTSAGIIGLAITQLSGLAGTLQTCLSSMAELETAFVVSGGRMLSGSRAQLTALYHTCSPSLESRTSRSCSRRRSSRLPSAR